jgi:hypothetical protein
VGAQGGRLRWEPRCSPAPPRRPPQPRAPCPVPRAPLLPHSCPQAPQPSPSPRGPHVDLPGRADLLAAVEVADRRKEQQLGDRLPPRRVMAVQRQPAVLLQPAAAGLGRRRGRGAHRAHCRAAAGGAPLLPLLRAAGLRGRQAAAAAAGAPAAAAGPRGRAGGAAAGRVAAGAARRARRASGAARRAARAARRGGRHCAPRVGPLPRARCRYLPAAVPPRHAAAAGGPGLPAVASRPGSARGVLEPASGVQGRRGVPDWPAKMRAAPAAPREDLPRDTRAGRTPWPPPRWVTPGQGRGRDTAQLNAAGAAAGGPLAAPYRRRDAARGAPPPVHGGRAHAVDPRRPRSLVLRLRRGRGQRGACAASARGGRGARWGPVKRFDRQP